MKKKLFTTVLCLVFIGLLAACGGDTAPAGTQGQQEAQGSEQGAAAEAADEAVETAAAVDDGPWDPMGRFDETVHVTQTRILATWMTFDPGEDEDYNWWTRAYYDQLNVSLTNLFTSPMWGPEFETRMNLAFATGDLPDVIPLSGALAIRAMQGNFIMDITDAFERYASPQVKSLFDVDPGALNAWTIDGRLMGLAQTMSTAPWWYFWVPESMLDEYNGGVIPTTFEELESLARWVRDHTGGYAFNMCNELRPLTNMLPMFGATHLWIEVDGQLEWGLIQPEVRDAWAQMAAWYAEGLLAPDFAVRTEDDVEADFVNRRMGLMLYSSHTPNNPRGRNFMALNPEDNILPIPMMSADGSPLHITRNAQYNDVLMINANAERPDAIMRMFNLGTAVSNDDGRPEWVTNVEWNTTPVGGHMSFWNRMGTGTGLVYDRRPEFDGGMVALRAIQAGSDGSDLAANRDFRALEYFDRVLDWINYGSDHEHWISNWAMWNMLIGGTPESATAHNLRMQTEGRLIASPRWGLETAAEGEHSMNLQARYREFATLAIMNDDVDNMFEEWVQFYLNNAGREINEQVAEWWAANRP